MSDLLSSLRAEPTPRSEVTASAVARQVDPPGGLALYGVLYVAVVANSVFVATLFGLVGLATRTIGDPLPAWATVAIVIGASCVGVVSYYPFARWKQRRLAPSLELGRNGQLLDGDGTVLYAPASRWALRFTEGDARGVRVAVGELPAAWIHRGTGLPSAPTSSHADE